MKYTKDKKIGKNILAILLVFAVFFTFPISTVFASSDTTTSSTTSSSCASGNHSMSVGNIGRWFNSRSEVDAYFSSTCTQMWNKYQSGAITRDEYIKNCPSGYKAWSCSKCNMWTGDFTYTEIHTHSYDSGKVTKEATCTANGVKTYTCSGCGATKTETIAKTNHNYVSTVINPTCTEQGRTGHICTKCNYSYDTDYIDATGHDYKYIAKNDGTHSKVCNACSDTIIEECNKIKQGNSIVCENCNAVYEETSTEPSTDPTTSHTHSYDSGVVTQEATCTANGIKTYTCSCGEIKTETISATGHSYDNGKITKEATCTTTGIKTYTCSKCKTTKTETISAKGHKTVTDPAKLPTCTVTGLTAGSHCSVCNTVITAQKTVSATGHSYDNGKITKAATCTTTGIKTYTCSKCKTTKTETISATGHKTVTDPAKLPTCTATGLTAGSHCSVCNTVITAQKTVSATGHSYDNGKITKAATATTTGIKTYTCTKCKATKTETISAKGLSTPNLKVVVNSNGTFTLSWNKIDGADKYELYIKQANGSYKLMKTTTATSFTTIVAEYGKQYSYKMRAVTSKNSSATSAYSPVVNAKNTKKLQTPALKVAVNKNGSFKLSWNKVTGATSYQLYIKQANGSYKLMKTTTATSFTTAVASKGKTYSYKVKAVRNKNSTATSDFSSVVSAKRK